MTDPVRERAVAAVDRRALGRRSRAKGSAFEGAVARYLTTWWPDARRGVTNGWRTASRIADDPYDISGTPGIMWSLKNYAATPPDEQCRRWLAEVESDAAATGALGVLVVKRPGVAAVSGAWAWRTVSLAIVDRHGEGTLSGPVVVRMTLADLVPVLLAEGYGDPDGDPPLG